MFTITGPLNIQLLKFWLFKFFNFQANLVKNLMEKLPGFEIDFESTDKVLPLHQYLWFKISRQWNSPLILVVFCFFLKFARKSLLLLSLILLKYIVVGYSNRNKSFPGRLVSNYKLLNMPSHFFRYLIYSVFHDTFVKRFMKKLSFFSSNFKNQFQDVVYYRKLGCLTLWYWNGDPLNVR